MIQLSPHALTHSIEESVASSKDDVLEQVLLNVIIALLNRLVGIMLHAFEVAVLLACFLRREQDLGRLEAFCAYQDFPAIGQFVILLPGVTVLGSLLLSFIINDDLAHFFLDVLDNLQLSVRLQTETSLLEDLPQVLGDIAAGQVNGLDSVRHCITFIDGHSVRNAVTRVQNAAGCTTVGVKRQYRLNANV